MVCFQTMCKHVSVLLIILSFTSTCMCDVPVCKTRTNLLLPPPSLQPHEIDVSSNQSRLELYVSKFSTSPIHLSVKQCIVPHAIIPSPAPSTVLGTPKAPTAHTYVVVRVGIISSELERRGLQLAIAVRLSSMSSVPSTLEGTDLLLPYEIETSLEHQYDTFLFPIFPLWRIEKCRIILRKMSPQTKYSFYAALHQVPAITDAERDRSPNLLDPYFLALGQPGASEDPKSVLQDLLDPDTLNSGSVELITDAAGKRHFQFGTLREDTATQMTFTRKHFPSTLTSMFTFALDAQLVIPQGSVDSCGCEICPALLNKLHIRNNSAEGHCLYITALHIEEHRVRSPSDADGNHLYPFLITVPWAEATMKLRRIEIRVKCDATSTLHYSIRPVGAFLINNEPPTSCPDLVHGGISSASGETVPTPDPHDTRDTTVSPVQPRSRGMGSLRAVVGALGAGRRSTSVVAAAVVRHGMPRTGRAGAWGTGRAALLVLGVVCGVGLLLAAVVCSLTWRYRIVGSKWNFHQFQSWVVEPAATSCPPKKCVTSSMGVGALSSV